MMLKLVKKWPKVWIKVANGQWTLTRTDGVSPPYPVSWSLTIIEISSQAKARCDFLAEDTVGLPVACMFMLMIEWRLNSLNYNRLRSSACSRIIAKLWFPEFDRIVEGLILNRMKRLIQNWSLAGLIYHFRFHKFLQKCPCVDLPLFMCGHTFVSHADFLVMRGNISKVAYFVFSWWL